MKIGKVYFLASLLLPVIVPLSILPIAFNNLLTALLIFSLWFGGVPYLIMSFGVIIWAKNKNETQLRKLSYVLPLLFVLVMVIVYLLFILYVQGLDFNMTEFVQIIIAFAGYAVAIGYFYVIVVNIIYELVLSKNEEYQGQS